MYVVAFHLAVDAFKQYVMQDVLGYESSLYCASRTNTKMALLSAVFLLFDLFDVLLMYAARRVRGRRGEQGGWAEIGEGQGVHPAAEAFVRAHTWKWTGEFHTGEDPYRIKILVHLVLASFTMGYATSAVGNVMAAQDGCMDRIAAEEGGW